MDFRLLVFDWDGTLMDSAARIVACIQAAMRDTGMAVLQEAPIKNIIGLGLQEAFATLCPQAGAELRAVLVERYRHHFLIADPTPSALFPGALELLQQLHRDGYLLAIATGKGRRGLDKVLEETGLGALFHVTRCADETASKPSPHMLLEIMERAGVAPAQTLMIGDTEYDLQMARNAGVHALAVSYGVHERTRLLQCGPLGCLDSLTELGVWLKNAALRAAGAKTDA
jgi:phosphoglycolate phosphatase